MTATAAPVSATSEQQNEHENDQNQFHGMLRGGLVLCGVFPAAGTR